MLDISTKRLLQVFAVIKQILREESEEICLTDREVVICQSCLRKHTKEIVLLFTHNKHSGLVYSSYVGKYDSTHDDFSCDHCLTSFKEINK